MFRLFRQCPLKKNHLDTVPQRTIAKEIKHSYVEARQGHPETCCRDGLHRECNVAKESPILPRVEIEKPSSKAVSVDISNELDEYYKSTVAGCVASSRKLG